MTLQTITVGIDGSAAALAACRFAVDLARTTNASVTAVHAWQTPYVCTSPGGSWTPTEATNHGHRLVSTALDAAGADCLVETRVGRGMPGPTLAENDFGDTDLTVIGTTGRSCADRPPQFGEILFGSTARYLANHAAHAVAVVPEGSHWVDDPTVVVGVDGSPTSIEALQWAVSVLPRSATIRVVQSIEMDTGSGLIPPDAELLEPVVEHHHRGLDELISESLNSDGVHVHKPTTHIVLGSAPDALLKPGFDVDLIVLGRHGHGPSTKVIGSVSDHTLRNSKVPVVIVPPSRHYDER